MRVLLARMVKDRTILFVIAPVVAMAAILGASALGGSPTQERASAEKETETTTTAPAAEAAAAGDDLGSSTYSPNGSPDRQAALGLDDVSGSGGYDDSSSYGGGYDVPSEVLDETVESTTTIPTETTVPGTPSTTPTSTAVTSTTTVTTTTLVGPPPVVSESPVVALLPVSGLVMAGLALGLLSRRRSRRRVT